jgi:hypothetical protein
MMSFFGTLPAYFVLGAIAVALVAWLSKQNLDRRTGALTYSLTRSKDYFEARSAIELRFRQNFQEQRQVSPSEVIEIIGAEKEIGSKLKFILAHWEVMAISIFDDLVDESTCFELVGSTLVNTVYIMEPYILKNRENPLNVRRHDYLLILYNEWKRRLEAMEADGPISRYTLYIANGRDIRGLKRRLRSEKRSWDDPRYIRRKGRGKDFKLPLTPK